MSNSEPHVITVLLDEKVLQHLEAELYEQMCLDKKQVWAFLVFTIVTDIRRGNNKPDTARLCDFNERFAALFGEPPQGDYLWNPTKPNDEQPQQQLATETALDTAIVSQLG